MDDQAADPKTAAAASGPTLTVHADTPSEAIVLAAAKQWTVDDARGRKITFRRLGPVGQMDLACIMGAERMAIQEVVNTYTIAFSVTDIDGERIFPPQKYEEIRAFLGRLDEDGVNAIMEKMIEVGLAARAAPEPSAIADDVRFS